MRETTGRASVRPDPVVTSAHLVSQTTSGLGMVRVTFPEIIETGKEKRAQVALEGGPSRWIGNATATVLLRSDSMATPLTTYSVAVSSRYSPPPGPGDAIANRRRDLRSSAPSAIRSGIGEVARP